MDDAQTAEDEPAHIATSLAVLGRLPDAEPEIRAVIACVVRRYRRVQSERPL